MCCLCLSEMSLDRPSSSFLHRLPKVELHAHLNGSISAALLTHLDQLKKKESAIHSSPPSAFPEGGKQPSASSGGAVADISWIVKGPDGFASSHITDASLSDDVSKRISSSSGDDKATTASAPPAAVEDAKKLKWNYCFKVFDLVYTIMDNLAFTKLAIQDVLIHYAMEHTMYLELRTSLRDGLFSSYTSDDHKPVSKEDYLRCVIDTTEQVLRGEFIPIPGLSAGAIIPLWTMYSELLPLGATGGKKGSLDDDEHRELLFMDVLKCLLDKMIVRLSVSVSRSLPLAVASETVEIAGALRQEQEDVIKELACCRERNGAERGGWHKPSLKNKAKFGIVEPSQTVVQAEEKAKVPVKPPCGRDLLEWTKHMMLITSIDFSGNAYKHAFTDFIPVLQRARDELGFAITMHAGEKDDDDELEQMISFGPHRWGHLVFVSERALDKIIRGTRTNMQPIELCVTSNMLTCGHTTVDEHHFASLLDLASIDDFEGAIKKRRVPSSSARPQGEKDDDDGADEFAAARRVRVSFNTDDRGVFFTSMTRELELVESSSFMHCYNTAKGAAPGMMCAVELLQRAAVSHAFPPTMLLRRVSGRELNGRGDSTSAEVEASRINLAHYCWLTEHYDQHQWPS